LTTFRTFTTADVVFDMLTSLYRMELPSGLGQAEIREWRERRLDAIQKRVLTVLTMWLEDQGLLDQEPHIAQRLTDFLALIVDPAPLALTAKLMLKSLERLVRTPVVECSDDR
jgi:son of sevenless-like protein